MGFWGLHCTSAIVPRADRGEIDSQNVFAIVARSTSEKKVITSPASPHHRPSSGIVNQKSSSVTRGEVH